MFPPCVESGHRAHRHETRRPRAHRSTPSSNQVVRPSRTARSSTPFRLVEPLRYTNDQRPIGNGSGSCSSAGAVDGALHPILRGLRRVRTGAPRRPDGGCREGGDRGEHGHHQDAIRVPWVTITSVWPASCRPSNRRRTPSGAALSRLPVGSSARTTDGSLLSAGRPRPAAAGRRTTPRAGNGAGRRGRPGPAASTCPTAGPRHRLRLARGDVEVSRRRRTAAASPPESRPRGVMVSRNSHGPVVIRCTAATVYRPPPAAVAATCGVAYPSAAWWPDTG